MPARRGPWPKGHLLDAMPISHFLSLDLRGPPAHVAKRAWCTWPPIAAAILWWFGSDISVRLGEAPCGLRHFRRCWISWKLRWSCREALGVALSDDGPI